MAIQFTCPSCGRPIEVDDELANQLVTCPFCRKSASAPTASNLTGTSEATIAPPGQMAGPSAPSSPLTNKFSWIALGCVGVTAICWIVLLMMAASIVSEMGNIDDPQEMNRRMLEEAQDRPGLQGLSIIGTCAGPIMSLAFAIIALVKRTPPRWPAVVALCVVGGGFLMLCVIWIMALMISPNVMPASS